MRLALVAGSLGEGGAERQLGYMVERLADRVAALSVFSLTRGEIWEERLRTRGIAVEPFGRRRSKLLRLLELIRRLRRFRPHVVHCQHSFVNPYAVTAGRILGSATVASVRGDVDRALERSVRWIAVRSLRRADRIVVNSEPALERLEDLGLPSDRLVLLPNAVDTDRFRPTDRQPRALTHLGFVGRLEPVKRPDRFVDLLDRLTRDGLAVRGVVAGTGSLLAALEEQATRRGLSGAIEFLGEIEDVTSVYRRLDLLVSTSEREGSPNVVLEAMASGLPVVAFGLGQVAALLSEQPRFVVAPGDQAALADRVERLVRDPAERRRIGRANRRRAVASHSPDSLDEPLERLYRPLVEARRARRGGGPR